jgi:uncharacterized protein YceK
MPKNFCYLLLLMVLVVPAGCSTVDGAANGLVNGTACGFREDAQSMTDPDRNGWGIIGQMDAWVQQHLW